MHDIGTLQSGGYRQAGLTRLKLACPLVEFPKEILELGDTLEQLDLSGTGLSSLPAGLGSALRKLRTVILDKCNFTVFPKELASCPSLETIVLRSNNMTTIPEDALPPRLRSLVLTDNRLTSLPSSIGQCQHLQECLLAANQLCDLPAEMAQCRELAVLRLSCNRLASLPSCLSSLPALAFLSLASNPCVAPTANGFHKPKGLASIAWSALEAQAPLGANTSRGLWHQSPHFAEDVAITLFRGTLAGDEGAPIDELSAYLAAGAHESLVTILGQIHGHPDEDGPVPRADDDKNNSNNTKTDAEPAGLYQGGLVTQLVPDTYLRLSQPPSYSLPSSEPAQHTQHDLPRLDAKTLLQMLTGLAGALAHLHARGIAHGALAPHSVLASAEDAHALLTGFGAATQYGDGRAHGEVPDLMEAVEVLAFGRLVEFLLRALEGGGGSGGGGVRGQGEEQGEVERGLWELRDSCVVPNAAARPVFEEVVEWLEGMMGWRGMMRIPDVVPR